MCSDLLFSRSPLFRQFQFINLFLVNEVGEKVDETIESLVNNNLWKSCTIQGETRDWESFNDNGRNTGTIHATG